MKNNCSKKNILSCLFTILSIFLAAGQNQKPTLTQDAKFEQLLNEKRKINASLAITDTYKIQIFTGNNETAKKTLAEFRQEFTGIDATIIFNTPNYKVWVGNFRTRIEAEKTKLLLKKRYPNLLLIKPGK